MYQNTKCRHLIFVYFDFILYSSPLKNSYSLVSARPKKRGYNIIGTKNSEQ